MQLRISIIGRVCPFVRPSVGPVLFLNVTSYAPMTTEFDMDQETVKDNS